MNRLLPYNDFVVIHDANHCVRHKISVEVVPFVVIKSELASIRVAAINMNDSYRSLAGRYSAAVLKFDSGDACKLPGHERYADGRPLLNAVSDERLADARALQDDRLSNRHFRRPGKRAQWQRDRIAVLSQRVMDQLYVC